MHSSEIVSVVWLLVTLPIIAAIFKFADDDVNKDWFERMEAYVFALTAFAAVAGAMAPQFIAYVLDIGWYSESVINRSIVVYGVIAGLFMFFYGAVWFFWLCVACFSLSAIGWLVTSLQLI